MRATLTGFTWVHVSGGDGGKRQRDNKENSGNKDDLIILLT